MLENLILGVALQSLNCANLIIEFCNDFRHLYEHLPGPSFPPNFILDSFEWGFSTHFILFSKYFIDDFSTNFMQIFPPPSIKRIRQITTQNNLHLWKGVNKVPNMTQIME